MDAKELRLNNWLQSEGRFVKVSMICDPPNKDYKYISAQGEKIEGNFYFDDLSPIPLTPSILEQAGTVEGRCFYTKHETKHNVTFVIWANYDGEYYFQTSTHNIHVKYVHQLQNLFFALTGEELSISFNQVTN